ncbi:MAG: 23S rRNA (uracil(1939)-C(5))-methyltransferase RlmD [Ignavibacteriales bacterium]|nr:MAG: 23S rRNA (uracil(1939)-C(5))-methyltransferase RlmD [Ignavibacteriales bacterium]
MKKNDFLELIITGYAFEGKGIARIKKEDETENNFVVFVNGSYPGDKVNAKITKVKKSYAEAKTENIIIPSPQRVKARCKYFGTCGGCKQQDLSYDAQLNYKHQQVEEIFKKLGGFNDFEMLPIIPSDNIFYYRNKMEFSFSDKRWLTEDEIGSGEILNRNFAAGLHVPNVYDKVLDIDVCYLQSELSVGILNFTREYFKSRNVLPYSTKTHTGFLRNLVIRQSYHTKDLMVNLVTSAEDEPLVKGYVHDLLKHFPEITTIINNINLKKASVAAGDYEKVFFGEGFITDMISNYTFRISANSFFQTNTLQAENLYRTALDFAELKGDEIVYDLYSGAGTIAIYISNKVKEVYAFESVQSAIGDAEVNAGLNDIKNVHFFNADLYKSFLPMIEKENIPKPSVVILDPPRSGLHKNTVEDVIKINPEKIVYVSCNPGTQVRDTKLFSEAGYKLIKMRPVDMFPHTYHIENVVLLIKENVDKKSEV